MPLHRFRKTMLALIFSFAGERTSAVEEPVRQLRLLTNCQEGGLCDVSSGRKSHGERLGNRRQLIPSRRLIILDNVGPYGITD
jgi:hypothetical protein